MFSQGLDRVSLHCPIAADDVLWHVLFVFVRFVDLDTRTDSPPLDPPSWIDRQPKGATCRIWLPDYVPAVLDLCYDSRVTFRSLSCNLSLIRDKWPGRSSSWPSVSNGEGNISLWLTCPRSDFSKEQPWLRLAIVSKIVFFLKEVLGYLSEL